MCYCYHYIESDISIKDFFSLIGTIITVIAAYNLISVQIRKNIRARWIDDFRKEVGNFVSFLAKDPKNLDLKSLMHSTSLLLLYFEDKQSHLELENKIHDFTILLNTEGKNERTDHFNDRISELAENIIDLAKKIIKEEQSKL